MRTKLIQSERRIDELRVAYFYELIRSGKPVPAIVTRKLPNGEHVIIDGIQRFEAARRLGSEKIGAYVVMDCDDSTAERLRAELNRVTSYHGLN